MKTIIIFLLLVCTVQAQDVRKDCLMGGDAKTNKLRALNITKNRYAFPTKIDTVDFGKFASMTLASIDRGTCLTAYVYNVNPGGVESCNCHAKDQEDMDTHITLTADSIHTEGKYRVIVEVTPRIRDIMKSRGIDWSTKTLRKQILHHWVSITGLLFADIEHANAAENTHPDGRHNWRRTIWELHPVTAIEIMK